MKKTALLMVLMTGLCTAAAIHAQTPAGSTSGRKTRVAVLDFDYATVHNNVSAIFGSNVDVGRGVTDLLVNNLVKDGSYSVIERRQLETILAEQNFSNSDRADASSAARIGKLLGVDAMIMGSITQFGNDTKSTGIGGVAGGLGRIGLGGVGTKNTKAIVGLTSRIVSIDTAEILAVAEGMGESKRTSTSLSGFGGGWSGFGGGNVNFGSSDFQNTIIGEAVKAATDTLTTNVVAQQGKVTQRTVTVQGLVAAVSGNQLILNVGSKAGVKVGDQLIVQRVSQEIKDPATGRVIRRLTTDVGVVRVVDVDAESSAADVVSGSGFQVSDAVRSAGAK
jgi:curli biogenesis system outer membrane secretion channel CsgG